MSDQERIDVLKRENIIWVIYILFAIFGTKANNLELADLYNGNNKNEKKYRTINIIIFIVAVFIYIYFTTLAYKVYQKNKKTTTFMVFVGSFLILIGGILFLIAEILDSEAMVPDEI